jgi:hypothetical protein
MPSALAISVAPTPCAFISRILATKPAGPCRRPRPWPWRCLRVGARDAGSFRIRRRPQAYRGSTCRQRCRCATRLDGADYVLKVPDAAGKAIDTRDRQHIAGPEKVENDLQFVAPPAWSCRYASRPGLSRSASAQRRFLDREVLIDRACGAHGRPHVGPMTRAPLGIPWAETWPAIRACGSVAIRIHGRCRRIDKEKKAGAAPLRT